MNILSSALASVADSAARWSAAFQFGFEPETFDPKDVKDVNKVESYMRRVPEGRERVVAVSPEGRLFSLDWNLLMTACFYQQLDSARLIMNQRPRSASFINSQLWKASDFAMDLGDGRSSPSLLALVVSTLTPPSQGPSMEIERILTLLVVLKKYNINLPLNVLMTVAADTSKAYCALRGSSKPPRRRRGNFD